MTNTNAAQSMEETMTNSRQSIWPGGTYQNAIPALEPSLIELAVKSSGQNVRRVCASHLHRLHANLSQDQLLSLICQDCPARLYFSSQAQARDEANNKPATMAREENPSSLLRLK